MLIEGPKLRGTFVSRPNRFLALVRINDEITPCYLPDPGRLKELLYPGAEVLTRCMRGSTLTGGLPRVEGEWDSRGAETGGKVRKTQYDVFAVVRKERKGEKLVSVDTRMPNRLVREALVQKNIKEFMEYDRIKPEFTHGSSRLDFMLERENDSSERRCLLEVKSCNLVVSGVALFPDAPTKRGRRHVEELTKAKSSGEYDRACILFIVQRDDAESFEPYKSTDPQFAEALCHALSRGVEAYAYRVRVSEDRMLLSKSIPVNAAPNSPKVRGLG
ncbi:MAG: DNA/RNA nuclease SfsA [Promethearchaeati archaeon SRVP18_Atabeyarchaeia-1]